MHAYTATLGVELLAHQLKGMKGTGMGYLYVLCMKTYICI